MYKVFSFVTLLTSHTHASCTCPLFSFILGLAILQIYIYTLWDGGVYIHITMTIFRGRMCLNNCISCMLQIGMNVYTSTHNNLLEYIHTYMHVYINNFIYMCVELGRYACICACWIDICLYVCMQQHTHAQTHTHIHTQRARLMYRCACVHTHVLDWHLN